jgi:NarL family two-component system response regulator LiaR
VKTTVIRSTRDGPPALGAALAPRSDEAAPLPAGERRAIVLSDSALLRAGVRALLPERGLRVIAELDSPRRLQDAVSATAAQLVVAAPADGGDERLFRALAEVPASCAAIVLLAVPGFRIQASTITGQYNLVCLPLNVDRDELAACVREALVRDERSDLTVEEICSGPHGTLSTREQEVLRELARGKTNREIADSLWVSEDTVKSHLRRTYRKLGVTTRSEAVALYVGQLGSP